MHEYKVEYERDDGRVSVIFIEAENEAQARETFLEETGYTEDRILRVD